MLVESNICPYTGLRPFTEDESIYFKGRDEHIGQATLQLQERKFIMLTGASGDGKSSLVYAGIIPNAKAGFLKSQYANWMVVDFRPERTPLLNLSRALASQLHIANENTVLTELGRGFASLINIYKASTIYQDASDPEWQLLSDKEKAAKKRGAANLIIIADQFEEFFTNPENFRNGMPSREAHLVTNLLLETARIALEERLPVYVIITMRSDFIGQCASFRGLPEAIGFSQFFVPRLNRSQLQEVIEAPAHLSGNQISTRLVERLIHDMVEGTDQLPILQHALNQIWKMADEGSAEMDLIHYAMVGGMSGSDLPEADIEGFRRWFVGLPPKIRNCYDHPDLHNVLNTHADKLYILAADYLKAKHGDAITDADVRQVIETAFKCLTKIDNGRAVRNRMTLAEITAILNHPTLDYRAVARILDIFREPGNTLLRPFFEETKELSENSVLDLTHESLIRNWENLDRWVKEEFASLTTYLDFSQQLTRWVESGKSNAFLLYIGPLTYFEGWYAKAKPNVTWIARYLGEGLDGQQRQNRATEILGNIQEFLPRSAKKHIVARTVMKYGAGKISAMLGLVALLVLSAFVTKTYLGQRNESLLQSISEQAIPLLNNPKVHFDQKGVFLAEQLRLNLVTPLAAINQVSDPVAKIELANAISITLIWRGRTEPAGLIHATLHITDSLLQVTPVPTDAEQLSAYMKNLSEWRATIGLAYFYNPSDDLQKLQQNHADRCANLAIEIIGKPTGGFNSAIDLSHALETAVNFNAFQPVDLHKVIEMLSPFEDGKQSDWVKQFYTKSRFMPRGYQGYGFNFNGLYQDLACLYAADGKVGKALQAIDTLLKYNEGYYEHNYTNMPDNASNVASVLYRTGHAQLLDDFVAGYCLRMKITLIEFYQRVLGRTKPYNLLRNSGVQLVFPESHNLNLAYGESGEVSFFYNKLRETIGGHALSGDESNFLLAISYKDQGILTAYRSEVVSRNYNRETVNAMFARSVEYYGHVGKPYLEEMIERRSYSSAGAYSQPRSSLYYFPDVIAAIHPFSPRDYHFNYISTSFLEYLIDNSLFSKFYGNARELQYIAEWLVDYHYHTMGQSILMRSRASTRSLAKIMHALQKEDAGSSIDLNLLYLHVGWGAYEEKDDSLAVFSYGKINTETLSSAFSFNIFGRFIQAHSMFLVSEGFTCMMKNGKTSEAHRLLEAFKKPANQASIYAYAARALADSSAAKPLVLQLLDSASVETERIDNANSQQPNKDRLANALLTFAVTDANIQRSVSLLKNRPAKYVAMQSLVRIMCRQHRVFDATQLIPNNIADADRIDFLTNCLLGFANSQPGGSEWKGFEDLMGAEQHNHFIEYVDETN